jgi:hypothetical protein
LIPPTGACVHRCRAKTPRAVGHRQRRATQPRLCRCVIVGGVQRPGPGCYAGIDAGYRPALGLADEPGWLPAIAPQSHRGPGQTGGTRAEMGHAAPIRGLGTNTSGDAAPDRGTPPRFGGRGINTSGDDTPQRGRETDHVPVCISCLPNGYPQAGMEPGAARWGHDGSP